MVNGGLIVTLIGAGVAIHATRQFARVFDKNVKPIKLKEFKLKEFKFKLR